jgi:hypothetical protein
MSFRARVTIELTMGIASSSSSSRMERRRLLRRSSLVSALVFHFKFAMADASTCQGMSNTSDFTMLKEDHTLGNLIAEHLKAAPNVMMAGYKSERSNRRPSR